MLSNTMSKLETRRLSHAARRDQLLEAARTEFLRHGYAGVRLKAIANTCGVTEALVYKHFESKQELFDAAVTAPLHAVLKQRMDDILALPVDPTAGAQLKTTREFMRTLLRTFSESVEAIGAVFFGDREHAQDFYGKHIRPLVDAAVDASEATMNRWPHRDYDVRTAMKAAFGMAFWLALDRVLDPSADELDITADHLADILFFGMTART